MATKTTKKVVTKKATPTRRSAPVRTTPARSTPEKVQPIKSTPESIESSSKKNTNGLKIKKTYLIPVLGVLLLAGLIYAFRSLFIAATVNGQPVSRLALVQELEKQNGKQALNSLVTKTLIFQEAREQNVTVSEDEINAELKKIEANLSQQGQKLDQVLTLQGMTKDSLLEQIRLQKMIEKMVGKDIKVSDQEVTAYIEANRESLPADAEPAALQKDAKERLTQQKLSEQVQTWLDKIQKEAKINYFVNY